MLTRRPYHHARRSGDGEYVGESLEADLAIVQLAQSGFALITVLLVTSVTFILAITLAVVASTESRSARAYLEVETAIQLADAGTERARRQIIDTFDNTYLSISNFLRSLDQGSLAGLSGVNTAYVDGEPVYWEITGVSEPHSTYGWIDVAATAGINSAAVQTVIRRIGFGVSSTFNLAMLSETTDCMFCHLRVNGDVGNLVFMRPGWGNEGGSGQGSGGNDWNIGGSVINGNVYAALDVTNDGARSGTLNGAVVTGIVDRYSTNSALPDDLDGDGIADFPPINREVAMLNALGSIGGGVRSCVVPLGGTYTGTCGTSSLSGTINGNLILEGTLANPIVIDGDVWVEGDVIIKGYVQGLGGLYAGRNIYFAGDVQGVNAPYRIDTTGRCVNETGVVQMTVAQLSATGFSAEDACARRSIADNTDTLRVGARGSVIIGDYTEFDDNGNPLPRAQRQSADFYRAQFGISGNGQFDRRNGDELRCSGGVCRNADNEVVSNANRVSVDAYDGRIRPGQVTSSGFSSWISETQYRDILGTEDFTYNTWRTDFSSSDLTGRGLAESFHSLIGSGFTFDVARDILDRKVNYSRMSNTDWNAFRNRMIQLGYTIGSNKSSFEQLGQSSSGTWQVIDDSGQVARYNWDSGGALRVVHVGNRTYETQVNRIDAFLYANQRIAGKTSMQAMSINGGLVARDIGVLAPGRSLQGPFDMGGDNFHRRINNDRATACSRTSSAYYVYGSEDCALTINYDHRLRNGGYGYNIIEGRVGITLDWRVADRPEDRVSP